MKSPIMLSCFALILAQAGVNAFFSQETDKKAKTVAFKLAEVDYFHRFTKDDQHEYTPAGQEDLKAWKDMVTINYYPKAKDGDALAATAEAVLGNYKANKARILSFTAALCI